jgi:hypothetical protein
MDHGCVRAVGFAVGVVRALGGLAGAALGRLLRIAAFLCRKIAAEIAFRAHGRSLSDTLRVWAAIAIPNGVRR